VNYLEYWTLTCYVSIVGSDLLIPFHFFFPLHCQSRADTASSSEALSFKKVDRPPCCPYGHQRPIHSQDDSFHGRRPFFHLRRPSAHRWMAKALVPAIVLFRHETCSESVSRWPLNFQKFILMTWPCHRLQSLKVIILRSFHVYLPDVSACHGHESNTNSVKTHQRPCHELSVTVHARSCFSCHSHVDYMSFSWLKRSLKYNSLNQIDERN